MVGIGEAVALLAEVWRDEIRPGAVEAGEGVVQFRAVGMWHPAGGGDFEDFSAAVTQGGDEGPAWRVLSDNGRWRDERHQ